MTEIMNRLHVSRSTVHHWIDVQGLPAIKVGRVTRILVIELDAFLAAYHFTAGAPL